MERFVANKATLVVADGEKPSVDLLQRYCKDASTVIALDGAVRWLFSTGVKPDLVIGDFDSVTRDECAGVATYFVDDQDCNDLEKAFRYCRLHNLYHVTVLGAFGLRVDHFLTNLYVLRKFSRELTITFVDDKQLAFMCPDQQVVFLDRVGKFLSLYPCSDEVGPITSSGVAYPLAGEMLSTSTRIGTLNRIVAPHAQVSCARGDLLIVVENQFVS